MIANEDELTRADDPPGLIRSPVEREARERLGAAGYVSLRDVTCEVAGGVARLGGRLPSQYLRQVAHAIVAGLAGVSTVLNQIEVAPRPRRVATLLVRVEGERGDPHHRSSKALA